jgi:hypothetical protein
MTIAIIITLIIVSSSFLTAALVHLLSPERRLDAKARRKASRLNEVPECGYFTRAQVARKAVNDSLKELGEEARLSSHEHVRDLRKRLRRK